MQIRYTKEESEEIFRFIFHNKEPKLRSTKIKINAMRVFMGMKPKFQV